MNVVKASLGLALFALVFASGVQAQRVSDARQAQAKTAARVYSGGWFEVRYPSDFTASGQLPSNEEGKFDSARFTSPDGKVAFYVY